MRKNATVHVLTLSYGEYEDTQTDIIGITSDPAIAEAWIQSGMFDPNGFHEVEVITLNAIDRSYMNQIANWMNKQKNPLCECGHRLLHHRGGKKRSCKHNSKYQHNKHECKEFRLAKTQ